MSMETEWGAQGYVRCSTCHSEYKSHLGAWGGEYMVGREAYCSNCGERTAVWVAERWPTPGKAPEYPPVGTHLTDNVLELFRVKNDS